MPENRKTAILHQSLYCLNIYTTAHTFVTIILQIHAAFFGIRLTAMICWYFIVEIFPLFFVDDKIQLNMLLKAKTMLQQSSCCTINIQ